MEEVRAGMDGRTEGRKDGVVRKQLVALLAP